MTVPRTQRHTHSRSPSRAGCGSLATLATVLNAVVRADDRLQHARAIMGRPVRSSLLASLALALATAVYGCGEGEDDIQGSYVPPETYSLSLEPDELDMFGPMAFVLDREGAPEDVSDVDADTRSLPELVGAAVYATEAARNLALIPAEQPGSITSGGSGWLILRWRADLDTPAALQLHAPPADGPASSSRLEDGQAFAEYYVAPGVFVPVEGSITVQDSSVDHYAEDSVDVTLSVAFDDVRIEVDGQSHKAASGSWVSVAGGRSSLPEPTNSTGGSNGGPSSGPSGPSGPSGQGGTVPYTFTCAQTGSSYTVDVPDDECAQQSKALAKAYGCNEVDNFSSTCIAYYSCVTQGDASGAIDSNCP